MTPTCLECAKLRKENERLQQEVIRQASRWLKLKKFVISLEQDPDANSEYAESEKP